MRTVFLIAVVLAGVAGCNEDGGNGFGRMKPPQPPKPPVLRSVASPKPREAYQVQPVNTPKPVQPFEMRAARGPQSVQPHKGQPGLAQPYNAQKQKAPVVRPDPKQVAAQQLLEQKK